ncbi:MAG: dTMP kinase [Planctomycetota bacterium]
MPTPSPSRPAPPDPALDFPSLRGRFVVFDGPDGSGKSTQLRRFIDAATAQGLTICEVREPGGTELGERIRSLLLDPAHSHDMTDRCQMLLYMASRAQLVEEKIRPALQRGELVLADRFISSTFAYQGTAGGIPIDAIEAVGRVTLDDCWPDLVVIFDVDERTATARMNPLLRESEFDHEKDRMEMRGQAFHRRVRQGYLDQANKEPDTHLVIDATAAPDRVYDALLAGLQAHAAHWPNTPAS